MAAALGQWFSLLLVYNISGASAGHEHCSIILGLYANTVDVDGDEIRRHVRNGQLKLRGVAVNAVIKKY